MAQIKKKIKKSLASSGKKRLFSETFFTTVLTTAREMPKTKGQKPDKMCQLILKTYPQQNRNYTQKPSIDLLGMSNPIFNFIFKLDNTHLLQLYVDMYILKCFFFK